MPSRSPEVRFALHVGDWSSHHSSCSSSLTHTKNIKKVTCFEASAQVRTHIHRNDFSESELEECWYTVSEMNEIRRGARLVAEWMNNASSSNDDDDDDMLLMRREDGGSTKFCQRGLEYRTREGAQRRRENKIRARNVVLREQYLQREGNMLDPEYMAKIYNLVSSRCQVAAHRLGKNDEREARSISS